MSTTGDLREKAIADVMADFVPYATKTELTALSTEVDIVQAEIVTINESLTARSAADVEIIADVVANNTDITTLKSTVAGHSTNIASNTTNIASNTRDIAAVNTAIASHAVSIAANIEDITAAEIAIEASTASIATNTGDIAAAKTTLANHTASIASNTANIATNTANIASNTAGVSLLADVVDTVQEALVAVNTELTSHASSIATNTSGIATNTTNISANTTSITSNTTNITANTDALNALQLTDYAALRAYSGPRKSVYVTGVLGTAAPSGIAGMFVLDAADTTSADNGGTVIVAGAKRFKRAFSGAVDGRWFGAKGDGVTDDTAAIQAALNSGAKLIMAPAGLTHKTTGTLTCPTGVSFVQEPENTIIYSGPQDRPAFVHGVPGIRSRRIRLALDVQSATLSDWSNDAYIGVVLNNLSECTDVDVRRVSGFTINLREIGDNEGYTYNTVRIGILFNGRISHQRASKGASGYINENISMGGRYAVASTTNKTLSRIGVETVSLDGMYTFNNKNICYKPSFELYGTGTTGAADGFPIIVRHGSYNQFLHCRNEESTKTAVLMTCENTSALNVASFDFDDSPVFPRGLCVQSDTCFGNAVEPAASYQSSRAIANYACENIVNLANAYNATNTFIRKHFLMASSGATKFKFSTSVVVNADSLQVGGSRAICASFNVRNADTLVIKKDVDPAFVGRINLRLFDAAGTLITAPNTLRVGAGSSMTWTTNFGGAYATGSDSANALTVDLPAGVVSVDILFTGGTANCKLYGYTISAMSLRGGTKTPALNKVMTFGEAGEMRQLAGAIPAWTSSVGDVVYNDAAAAGGTLGWVYTLAGWKSFGAIAA